MPETSLPEDPERTARITKLQLETALLERQLSPRFEKLERRKANAAIAGIVAATVAVAGLILSSYQWFTTARRSSEAAVNERIAHEMEQLTSPSVPARLTAVASLTSLLTAGGGARQPQILQTFINDLAVEDSPLVRSAVLSALRQPTTPAIPKPVVDAALDAALNMSRAIVLEGRLMEGHRRLPYEQPRSPAEYRAESMAEAIRILLGRGATSRNFSRAYLWGVDFRKLDLKAANFDRALVSRAVFDGANLTGASFNDAFLDGTSFVGSEAAFCHFDQVVNSQVVPRESFTSYSARQLLDLGEHFRPDQGYHFDGPRYDCADLRNSTFRNHQMFLFSADDYWRLGSYSTSFRGARLDNADLRTITVMGMGRGMEDACTRELFITCAGGDTPFRFLATFDTDVAGFKSQPPSEKTRQRFAGSIKAITDAFAGAQWQRAKLPRPLASLFGISPPSVSSDPPCPSLPAALHGTL